MRQSKEEKKIQASILKALRQIEGCTIFAHTASPYAPTGHSDTYGSIWGWSIWGEVKVPGEEPSKIQAAFLRQVGRDSIYKNTFVWYDAKQAVNDILQLSRLVKGKVASNTLRVTPPPIIPQSMC